MEQMQIPEDMKVDVDYDTVDLPDSAKILEPVVFKEGDSYYCLPGPDPQTGILIGLDFFNSTKMRVNQNIRSSGDRYVL
jgi:hypothetical protein